MVPAGDSGRSDDRRRCCRVSRRATSSSTAATRTFTTPSARAERARDVGDRVHRLRHERRHLGTRERLLPDGRRRATTAVKHCEPIFTALAPADGYAHVGPTGRGPLREDGAQRHRVRAAAGVRRGIRDPRTRRRSFPKLDLAADRRGVAARQRRAVVAQRARRRARSRRTPGSRRSRAGSPIRAKDAGPCRKRSTSTCRRR